MKLGATGTFQDTNQKITYASYVIALKIEKKYNWWNIDQVMCIQIGWNCIGKWIKKKAWKHYSKEFLTIQWNGNRY